LPRSNRQREGLEASGAVHRALGGAQSLASDIEPLGPRQHPPPCDYVYLSVDGFCTCRWGTLRDDDDDFEEYSTAAITDNLREHQAAGPHFPLMPATICRLTPPRTMRGSSQGKDCRSRLQEPTPADVLAEVRVTQVRKIDCSTVEVTRNNSH
jgi:hypothetical protein